jgi:mRNA-degrading endonuclease YafQ of YafQ-DinJ toxin-antitoxin module
MKILLSGQYNRMYRDLCAKNSEIVETIIEKVILFRKNYKDTRLLTHPLHKHLKGKYAFSVTNNHRIIFEWVGKSTARFLAIGTHKEVYKKTIDAL